jgi:hypothetical protein
MRRRGKPVKAKYPGHSTSCDDKIIPGQTIYYVNSKKLIHLSCGTKEVQPEVKAIRAKPPDITPEAWEQQQDLSRLAKENCTTTTKLRATQFRSSRLRHSPRKEKEPAFWRLTAQE